PAQVVERLKHFCRRGAMDIEGLGEVVVRQFVEEGLARDAADLYSLDAERVAALERLGEKSAENIIRGLEASKSRPLRALIHALAISFAGTPGARLLAREYATLADLAAASPDPTAALAGLGGQSSDSFAASSATPASPDLVRRLS